MKIVHLVSSLSVGGMEQFAVRMAQAQRQQGHEVRLIGLQGGPLLEQARSLGLNAGALGGGSALPRLGRAAWEFGRWRPDIVHPHNPSSLNYALLARLAGGAQVVMTRHGQGDKSIGPPWFWKHIGAVVAVSDAAGNAFRGRYPDQVHKIAVIHNGIQLGGASRDRAVVRNALGLSDQVVGIIAARVDGNKGHDTLLHALAMLQEQGVPTTLLVVGDGAARAALELLAGELNLGPDRVRFLGFRTDVPDLLGASDFFVLPSLTEGLPLCVLEAMASHLPVVATPVGGIPEVVADAEHGFLVPVNDASSLAHAIATLAGDAALRRRLGDAGHRRVQEHFSFEEMVRRYETLYRRLISA